MGTIESCEPMVWSLRDVGVDEVACLIDFGIGDVDEVLESLGAGKRPSAGFSRKSATVVGGKP